MVCEQILGKLSEFDTSGKTIEYVDIEWHEAFKKIHKKTTDHGTELGIRMDDSILTRGLYQGDMYPRSIIFVHYFTAAFWEVSPNCARLLRKLCNEL